MLSKEDFAVIKALKRRGVYQKDIAEQLGVHPKTVSRALQRGAAPQSTRKHRVCKLDPYKPTVDRLLSEGVWNAVVILREIQAEGYSGELHDVAGIHCTQTGTCVLVDRRCASRPNPASSCRATGEKSRQ